MSVWPDASDAWQRALGFGVFMLPALWGLVLAEVVLAQGYASLWRHTCWGLGVGAGPCYDGVFSGWLVTVLAVLLVTTAARRPAALQGQWCWCAPVTYLAMVLMLPWGAAFSQSFTKRPDMGLLSACFINAGTRHPSDVVASSHGTCFVLVGPSISDLHTRPALRCLCSLLPFGAGGQNAECFPLGSAKCLDWEVPTTTFPEPQLQPPAPPELGSYCHCRAHLRIGPSKKRPL